MKRPQALSHRTHLPGSDTSGGSERGQRGALVIAAHLHHVVDRRGIAGVGDLEPVTAVRDGPHAHVQVRGQARVQAHLLLAHRLPASGGAVVHEVQDHWLLELERPVAGHEHP